LVLFNHNFAPRIALILCKQNGNKMSPLRKKSNKNRKRKGKDSEITPTSVASRRDRSYKIGFGGQSEKHRAPDGQVEWAEEATTTTDSFAGPATPCPPSRTSQWPKFSLAANSLTMSNESPPTALPRPCRQSNSILRDRSRNIGIGGRRGKHLAAAPDGQVAWAEVATTAMFAGATSVTTESLACPAISCSPPPAYLNGQSFLGPQTLPP